MNLLTQGLPSISFFLHSWIFYFVFSESASKTGKFKQAAVNMFEYQWRTSDDEQQQQKWESHRNSCVRFSCFYSSLKQLCASYHWNSCVIFINEAAVWVSEHQLCVIGTTDTAVCILWGFKLLENAVHQIVETSKWYFASNLC